MSEIPLWLVKIFYSIFSSSSMKRQTLHLPEALFYIQEGKRFLHTILESGRPLKHEININRMKNKWDTNS